MALAVVVAVAGSVELAAKRAEVTRSIRSVSASAEISLAVSLELLAPVCLLSCARADSMGLVDLARSCGPGRSLAGLADTSAGSLMGFASRTAKCVRATRQMPSSASGPADRRQRAAPAATSAQRSQLEATESRGAGLSMRAERVPPAGFSSAPSPQRCRGVLVPAVEAVLRCRFWIGCIVNWWQRASARARTRSSWRIGINAANGTVGVRAQRLTISARPPVECTRRLFSARPLDPVRGDSRTKLARHTD